MAFPPIGTLDPNTDTIPLIDQNRGFRYWLDTELYTGPNGSGKYVPNVNDAVRSWENGDFRVTDVDYTTGEHTRVVWTAPAPTSPGTDYDKVLGSGPGLFQSENQRIYFNGAVTPHTLNVDRQLYVYGREVKWCVIFRGYDTGVNGVVIGTWYDANGTDPSYKIPLETVGTNSTTGLTIKTPSQAYTTVSLTEGEPCTVVFYSESGSVLSRSVLYTSVTTFTRPIELGQRVITGIELVSPNLDPTDNSLLLVPSNVTVESLILTCRVYYNDSYTDHAIDGTKVRLDGINEYVATIEGERAPLVLTYVLSSEEASIVGSENTHRFIAKPYWAKTKAAEGAISVKMFPLPVWVDAVTGWELEWYLYNADRREAYYATPYIEQAANTAPFSPLKYGVLQEIGVSVDISKVSATLPEYRHTQTLGITLTGNPLDNATPWLLRYAKDATAFYGQNLSAEFTFNSVGNWSLDISCGIATLDLWLEQVFYRTYPLFIEGAELKAPAPTHFLLVLNNIATEYPISAWNQVLTVTTGLNVGESVALQFFERLGNTDLQLGVSPLVVHHTNVTKTS